MSSQPKTRITPQEYLAIEREAEFKSEYFDGEMFALAGARENHTLICSNLARFLGNQLADRPCYVYPNEMRIKVVSVEKYTYPDVAVVCGERFFEDETRDTLLNPMVIIEVLSKSTEGYDRGAKFEYYQLIESLTDYILITQKPYRVEHFVKQQQGRWTYYDLRSADDILKLDSVGCEVSLNDIYLKVE